MSLQRLDPHAPSSISKAAVKWEPRRNLPRCNAVAWKHAGSGALTSTPCFLTRLRRPMTSPSKAHLQRSCSSTSRTAVAFLKTESTWPKPEACARATACRGRPRLLPSERTSLFSQSAQVAAHDGPQPLWMLGSRRARDAHQEHLNACLAIRTPNCFHRTGTKKAARKPPSPISRPARRVLRGRASFSVRARGPAQLAAARQSNKGLSGASSPRTLVWRHQMTHVSRRVP